MKNPTGNKLEKLIFGMFDQMVEGADKYVTKQESTWLIFTEDKRWVIEFTRDKTLWFNYNIFQSELELIGKDCTEERDLIKRWFESRFLNKPKVWATFNHAIDSNQAVEDAIENGVKHTEDMVHISKETVEDTIQNGVKYTQFGVGLARMAVEDTIQNGVKNTLGKNYDPTRGVEDIIQNGVKETTPSGYLGSIEMKGKIVHQIESPKQNNEVEDIIQNGVKNTLAEYNPDYVMVEDTIQNGVKDTLFGVDPDEGRVEDAIQNGVKDIIDPFWVDPVRIKDAIQNGVKDTRSYSDRDKKIVGDIIQSGVKETYESKSTKSISLRHAIKNGVKHVEDGDWLDQDERIDDIIENGVKETKEISNISLMSEFFNVNARRAIRDGVKELKELPDKSGELRGYGDWYHRQGNMTKPHTEYVKEVIEDSYNHMGRVEGVIRNTDKDGI